MEREQIFVDEALRCSDGVVHVAVTDWWFIVMLIFGSSILRCWHTCLVIFVYNNTFFRSLFITFDYIF